MSVRTGLERRGPDTPLIAAAIAGCLFFASLTALSLVMLERIKYTVRAAAGSASLTLIPRLLEPPDFVLLALVAGSLTVVLLTEWRAFAFRRLLGGESPLCLLALSAAALIWLGHAILAPGLIVTGDAGTHVARVNHLAMALQDGSSLYWDNYFFGGSTLLQFTGPLFHWAAAAIQILVGDPVQAVKYAAFLARLGAAGFMYGYARRLGLTRPVSVLMMLFYAGSWFVTYMEMIRSSFPQLVNFAAMPAILFFVEGVLAAPAVFGGGTVGLALGTIAFVGSHPPTALIFGLFVAVYIAARLTMTGWSSAPLRAFLVSGLMAGLGSVFFLVPFAAERAFTADNFAVGSLMSLAWPASGTLHNMAVRGRAGLGADYSAWFGLPVLGCTAAGLWLILTRGAARNDTAARLFLLCLGLAILSLFVRGAYVRHVTFTFFFLCAASGLGLQLLTRAFPRASWLPALVFVLFLLDAGPAAVQPWLRTDLRFIQQAGATLAARAADQRVVEITLKDGTAIASVDPSLTPLTAARVQVLNGPHKQDATPAHNAFAAMLRIAGDDLGAGGTLTPAAHTMLGSVNAGWIVGDRAQGMGLPPSVAATGTDPLLGRVLRLADASPVLTAGTLEIMARPASFDTAPFWNDSFDDRVPAAEEAKAFVLAIARRMDIDLSRKQAVRFLVPHLPDGMAAHTGDGSPPHIALTHYEVRPDRVHAVIYADRAGFLRLAHPVTPALRVTRNGDPVTPVADVEGLTVLPMTAGTNDITLVWVPSRLRVVCFWITALLPLVLLAGLAGQALLRRVRHREPVPPQPQPM